MGAIGSSFTLSSATAVRMVRTLGRAVSSATSAWKARRSARDAFQHEVDVAGERPALAHGRPVPDPRPGTRARSASAWLERCDEGEEHDLEAERLLVHQRAIALDDARLLQRPHAPQAGRRRHADPPGELDIGHAAIGLELPEDLRGRCRRGEWARGVSAAAAIRLCLDVNRCGGEGAGPCPGRLFRATRASHASSRHHLLDHHRRQGRRRRAVPGRRRGAGPVARDPARRAAGALGRGWCPGGRSTRARRRAGRAARWRGPLPDIAIASGRRAVPPWGAEAGVGRPHLHGLPEGSAHRRRARPTSSGSPSTTGCAGPTCWRPSPRRTGSRRSGSPRRAPRAGARLAALPRPRVALLLGGDSRHYRFTRRRHRAAHRPDRRAGADGRAA